MNSSSYIKSKGSLRHTPLKQKGNFELKHFSLSDLNPYIKDMTYTQLDDGYLSLKTQTEYSKSLKSPDLKVKGSMKLEDVFVNDTRDDNTILSFNEFGFKSFFFELQPNRLYVNEANLDAFYIDTIIDKSKQINFASLMKPVEKIESKEETNSTGKEEFPFRITKLDVNMGSAKFADYSIPIKFKTDIHDLDGHVYGISNLKDETSYVDIAGEIDKYGATSIKGSFNSDPKKYTEIDVQFKNLNLNSMSGYSASFAGYEIDDGKLFLDLKYNILNSNLQAENSVIVKKIELGKEFEDENVTSLPLGFVIALLEDKDGIIDIDMPVYGNVDEPDFKYGALVMKTLGNLLLKAVTSPFTFLGEMMGIDADKLGSLDFKAGEILITPPEREKLDNVAKMLLKRPKLSLNVSGTYDKVIDKRALQLEKLITLIVNKSGIKNRENHQSVMSIDLLEDIYEDAKDDNKLDEIEERLEKGYEGDAYDRAYKKELIRETMSLQEVSLEELKALAVKRAKVIKNYLVQEKNIKQERIVIKEIGISEYDEEKLVHTILDISVK